MDNVAHSPGGLERLATLLGAPEAALRLLLSILLGFPVALLHRYTLYGKDPTRQHLFFIACGLLIGYWNYDWNILHLSTAVCGTYLILTILGNNGLSVIVTFLFNMSYLLYGYYTTSTQDYDIKWTMPQCVLTLRLIGLGFNVWDGQKRDEKLSDTQKQVALKERPSLLEIAAYAYFPGAFLIGPQFSMRRYLNYVNGQLAERDPVTGAVKLPDCVSAGLMRALVGFVYVAVFQIGTLCISDQYFFEPSFQNLNLIQKCLLIGIWGRINLYKYISVWLITEGVCITFGLTHNGKDSAGRIKWDGCANVKLRTFEGTTQFNHYIMSFNINTNHWCAEYIYKRLKFLGSKIYSQVITLLFLAVWHGLHSGYYHCFFMEFLVMYFERDIAPALQNSEKVQTLMKTRWEARLLSWIFLKLYTLVFMGYSLVSFIYLSYPRYSQVYASVYYCGHVFFLSYPLLAPYIKRWLIGQRHERQRSHQE
ncbi:lysophospholipid acyltransferase 5 [Pseudomyrmex gracilis]|uniref:lysophospholipid acyltransferase 5 n=1 Tax=Pseudomyrmex gracilis TaxID=219809 RepID=UPI000994B51C|nr:lysophospholipid acyltransferase 5 [Pseudomyrmex gracilis]